VVVVGGRGGGAKGKILVREKKQADDGVPVFRNDKRGSALSRFAYR